MEKKESLWLQEVRKKESFYNFYVSYKRTSYNHSIIMNSDVCMNFISQN